MSSTNKTSNYELSQFIGSDKPAWLVDYNGDMSKIDNQMKANADAAATAASQASSASTAASGAADGVQTLNTQINGAGGIAADVTSLQGSVNTINSLIGNGEPTTTDKTIIGAINELDAGKANDSKVGDLTNLDTTNKTSVVAAINEVVAAIPSAGAVELQTGTLTSGQTSVVLTFSDQEIGASSLIDVYVEDGINYSAIATTSTTVTLTFDAQAADKAVAVRVTN